jgi:hypothetical protein
VGTALLVVLERLSPAERLAFVLHDTFGVPFDEIAPIVGCSPVAARQLASRARRRVRSGPAIHDADVSREREVVDAFLRASRRGDFDALLAVLDPQAVLRMDESAVAPGAPRELHGAAAIARRAAAAGTGGGATLALVDGRVSGVLAPLGRLLMVFRFTIDGQQIAQIEAIADPDRLRRCEITLLDG